MTSQQRQTAGTPQGGQFAASPHAEADVDLDGTEPVGELSPVEAARADHRAAADRLAQADFEAIRERTQATWPGATALKMSLGPDDDWGVMAVVDDEGKVLANWVDSALLDHADIATFVRELDELGLAHRYVDEVPDSNDGVLRLDRDDV
jgi:hypothetical protein